ncbi:hypothetical protein [Rhodococcus daqingensis]|uniref:Dioxygenase n=1 Tax=Rhodococcus daqingensis TaxID=2479363 RepID=A0ABW2RSS9_9NOCA
MDSGEARPHRLLRVLVDSLAIEDGQTPPPAIGDVGTFPLLFEEIPADDADPTILTVTADAEPLADGKPRLEPAAKTPGAVHRRWEWSIFLRGDGWSARWNSPRPAIGRVEVTGRLIGDLGYATEGRVRGRVTRVRLETRTFRTEPGPPPSWTEVPGASRLHDLERSPRWFNDGGMFADESASTAERETGVLVDLDLDDVPPLPLRPSICPDAVSAHGDDLWVADRELPVVIRVRRPSELTEYLIPGRVYAAPGARRLRADASGCWVAGWDGIFRCGIDGAVHSVSDRPVDLSAASGETLLTYSRVDGAAVLGLWGPGGHRLDLRPPDGDPVSMCVHGNGFLVLLRDSTGLLERDSVLVNVSVEGEMAVGPTLDMQSSYEAFLTAEPPRLFNAGDGRVFGVTADLTLSGPEPFPGRPFDGGTIGDRIWIVHHPTGRIPRRLVASGRPARLQRLSRVLVDHAARPAHPPAHFEYAPAQFATRRRGRRHRGRVGHRRRIARAPPGVDDRAAAPRHRGDARQVASARRRLGQLGGVGAVPSLISGSGFARPAIFTATFTTVGGWPPSGQFRSTSHNAGLTRPRSRISSHPTTWTTHRRIRGCGWHSSPL